MCPERGKLTNPRKVARVRIATWAATYRAVMMRGAPNPSIYNRSAFMHERIDTNRIREFIELGERVEEVLETDGWIQEMRKEDVNAFEALFIQHVEREPGGRRRLDVQHRVRLWKSRTGLAQTTFYDKLGRAERYVGSRIRYPNKH